MIDVATLTARLQEAELKYHQLVIGGQPKVFVDQNGERIEYTQASAPRLAAYISQLKSALGYPGFCNSGPLNVWM